MKISIASPAVDEKKWSKGDRSGVIRTQEAMAECAAFRQSIRLDLGKNDPFPVGQYDCDLEKNVRVGDFGDLTIARRLTLSRIAPQPAVKAA
jgi:hypothetical protein